MNMFERIHIQGFRRLYDVDLKLKPLNVMIGANGSGKTSLLDVFSLLSASAEGELKKTLSGLGGLESSLTNLSSSIRLFPLDMLSFSLSTSVDAGGLLSYCLRMTSSGPKYAIAEEKLVVHHPPDEPVLYIESDYEEVRYLGELDKVEAAWSDGPSESALSQIPTELREPIKFRQHLAASTRYHSLDVSRRAPVRLPQPLQDARLPGENGEDLVSCLFGIRENDPNRFETVQNTLRAGFPRFERLNFPPVAAGTLAMTWKEETSRHPFYMHQLSEGTLRFLWLVTLLNSPGLPAITMIDEPEVSLHPELLAVLVDVMREASQRTQLFVATHSDRLIRYLRPEEVLTIDLDENGAAQMTWADELDLNEWLAEYTLDEVWRMGRMGGRS